MTTRRNITLAPRKEGRRELKPIAVPVHFSLQQIKSHFEESVEAIKAQSKAAESFLIENDLNGCKMIWRSQVVLAEGLLDFYIHEVSKYCLFRMFSGEWEKTEKYTNFLVPMSKVEEAIAATQSKEWFFNYLNDRFSRDVFLSKEGMKDQLNLIGIGFNEAMRKAFPNESLKDASEIIQALFQRRNQIAHQNDRSHYSAEQADITADFVEDYIAKIEKIVNAIHGIAEGKSKAAL